MPRKRSRILEPAEVATRYSSSAKAFATLPDEFLTDGRVVDVAEDGHVQVDRRRRVVDEGLLDEGRQSRGRTDASRRLPKKGRSRAIALNDARLTA
jgi:hypothetical protein